MSNTSGSATPPAGRRKFVLEVEDAGAPDDAPVIIRLRRFLKAALRAYNLRCVRAVECDSTGPNDPADEIADADKTDT